MLLGSMFAKVIHVMVENWKGQTNVRKKKKHPQLHIHLYYKDNITYLKSLL
jgi:hypothetical protein